MAAHRQVTYNLASWSPNQRGELVALLTGRGISHDWRTATTLVVADLVESEVDGMIEVVHGADDLVLDEDGTKRVPEPHGTLLPAAPLVLRAWAFLADAVLTSVAWWLALGPAVDGSTLTAGGPAVGAAILACYFVGFVALFGRTPGKMALKLEIIVLETGERPGPLRAAVRFVVPNAAWVARLVLGLTGAVDALWQAGVYGAVLANPRRRGLHDLVAGTVVVRRRPD